MFRAGSVGCIITFIYVLLIGRFKWPTKGEWALLAFGVLVIMVWRESTATTANIILAGILAYSFEPVARGVWLDPFKEKSLAWWLWTLAFSITAINIFFFNGGWTPSLVVPVVGMICHGMIAVLSSNMRKEYYSSLPW